MADDRLPWRRSVSIVATRSDSVRLRSPAICLRPCQKASSRLTPVLCPAMTIDRLTTGDFIPDLLVPGGALRDRGQPLLRPGPRASIPLWSAHVSGDFGRLGHRLAGAVHACGRFSD